MDRSVDASNREGGELLPCRNLRTQSCEVGADGNVVAHDDDTETAVYWCLVTLKPVGPDGDACEPDACGPERACCESRKRPRLS